MFVLVEVIEREISVTGCTSEEEARQVMKNRLAEVLGAPPDDEQALAKAMTKANECDYNCDIDLASMSAWANTNNPGNCDWKIVEVG